MLGINLSGAEFGKGHRYGYDYIYPSATDLAFYSSRGVELVRLPFKWERMQKQLGGELDQAELGRMKTFLAAAEQQGVKVILDLHNYGRYGGKVIGSAALPNELFADFWAKLAREIGSSNALYGYGLMNEPNAMGGANVWRDAAQAAVDAIREIDTSHTILVAGDGWSSARHWTVTNRNLLIDDPADNLLYEAHVYFDNDNSGVYDGTYDQERAYANMGMHRIKNFTDWLAENNVKGFIGEFAVPGNDPRWLTVLDNFLAGLEEIGMSGTYWGAGPWFGNYELGLRYKDGRERPQLDVLEKYLRPAEAGAAQGSAGDDQLSGDRGGDVVRGLEGNDILFGSLGADLLDGGIGSDTVSYLHALGAVDVDLLRSQQIGSTAEGDRLLSIENLTGSRHDDVLQGDDGANTLLGMRGDDRLAGRGGADLLDGGEGSDTADYSQSAAAVQIDLSAEFQRGGDAEGDRLVSIENVIGSAFDDILVGNAGANRLSGGDGNDHLIGARGKDIFDGGAGIDTLDYSRIAVPVRVDLRTGVNNLYDQISGIENLIGSAKEDVLVGSDVANHLVGGAGNDRLDGAGGADVLDGGAGNDVLIVDNAGDRIVERSGEGRDRVEAWISFALPDEVEDLKLLGSDAIDGVGNELNNLIVGNDGANRLSGGEGADILRGGEGADRLEGGEDADRLWGGAGDDVLIGGAGADRFNFDQSDVGGRDVILDFSRAEGDRINLSKIDANLGIAGNQGFRFIGGRAFGNKAGELRSEQSGNGWELAGDLNGDGIADIRIHVVANAPLAGLDLIL